MPKDSHRFTLSILSKSFCCHFTRISNSGRCFSKRLALRNSWYFWPWLTPTVCATQCAPLEATLSRRTITHGGKKIPYSVLRRREPYCCLIGHFHHTFSGWSADFLERRACLCPRGRVRERGHSLPEETKYYSDVQYTSIFVIIITFILCTPIILIILFFNWIFWSTGGQLQDWV